MLDTAFKGLLIAFFITFTGTNTALYAQSTTRIDTGKIYKLNEIIVSATRLEEDPSGVGRNVSVITREDISASLHTDVGSLLAEQQGIHLVGAGQTPGSLQNVFLRNTNSNHTIVMIDGIRISDPSTVDNSIDLSELSLTNVERIEIVRGSHSTLYGSSAIGGVINIITRKDGPEKFTGTLETGHGTFGKATYRTKNRLHGAYTFQNGIYMQVGLGQQLTNGLDATTDTVESNSGFNPQDRDDFEKIDLSSKIGYRGSIVDMYLAYRNVNQHLELDQGSFNDDDNAKIDFGRDLIHYGATFDLNGRVDLNLKGGYSDLARDFVNDSSVINEVGDFDGSYTETNAAGTLWENELTTRFKGDHFSLIGGMGYSEQTMDSRTVSLFSPANFRSETDLDSLDLKETMKNVFVHTEWNGGLVHERLEPLSLVVGGRLQEHNRFGVHGTFEINPRYRISENALLFGAVTSGFNAPSLYQLHAPEQGFGAITNRGNPNLEPETSISYELGWKQSLDSRFRFNVSLFKTQVENVIEYVYLWNKNTSVENLTFADYLGDTYLNVSRQDIYGVEIGVNASLFSTISVTGNVSMYESELSFSTDVIDPSYTGGNHIQIFESGKFISREDDIDGLTRRPSFSATWDISYRPENDLEISLLTRYVGQRDDIVFSSTLGPFGALDRSELDGYVISDLKLRYGLPNGFRAGIKIENIFNSDYTEITGFNTRGRGMFGNLQYSF